MPPTRRLSRVIGLVALGALVFASQASAKPPPSPPLFGVVTQSEPSDADFTTMREGGVGTFRWLVSWPAVQPSAEVEPEWATIDRVVANLAEAGIQPVPLVHGSPCFAVDCERIEPPWGHSQPPLGSPHARGAWAKFLRGLVERYGSRGEFWSDNPSIPYQPIRVWQVWNEQNSPVYWRPSPSVGEYAELLRISSRAIASRDPDAQIILGGMFGHPPSREALPAPEFLDRLYRVPGARRYFDGVAVHPYAPQIAGVERQILAIRRVLARHDAASTPIWLTELGWASGDRQGRLFETRQGQARRLEHAFRLLRAKREQWNIASALWFAWRDVPRGRPVCEWCHTAGLFDAGGKPKPAWSAYTELSARTSADAEDSDSPPLLIPLAAALVLAVAAGAWLTVGHRRAR